MKKGLVFLTLLVFVVSAFSLGFTDVGLDNWAYDYVMKLVEKGVIPVDQPTFKGYEPLTRSDAAVWMSRLITYLENSPEIAKTKDLEYLESKVTDLSKKMSALESSLTVEQAGESAVVSQDVAQLQAKVSQLESKLSQTESSLKTLNKTVEQDSMIVKGLPVLSRKVYDLEEKVNSLEEFQSTMTRNHLNLKYETYDKIDNLSNQVSDLETSFEDFKTTMTKNFLNLKYDTYDKIDNLSNQVSAHDEKLATLESEVANVKTLAEENAMFVKALPSLSMKVSNNEAKIEEVSRELEVQKEEIAKAQDHRLLWLTAVTGVGLGIIAICLNQGIIN
ncbi:MAG TPA: S-layer homology domain-containing protein [Defluviitoga tunisiensis]|nr:S-layer homology domain-containing protein [Defluviitoga tunisiensis]